VKKTLFLPFDLGNSMTSNVQSIIQDLIVDERIALEPLEASVFDTYLSNGWRLLGHGLIRHNFTWCRGKMCNTIPLRIRLADFEPSKSQRKLLQRNKDLSVILGGIRIDETTESLFFQHNERLKEQRPASIFSFLSPNAANEPVPGLEFRIYEKSRHVCSSFIHLGAEAASATYCIFDPSVGHRSLGQYSMLLELLFLKEKGYTHYYHGYVNDVPSQFDYKLNFNALEQMNWANGAWSDKARQATRQWSALVEPYQEKETREVDPLPKDSLEWLKLLDSV
jgi:leucyl-tRNA---protein transferase